MARRKLSDTTGLTQLGSPAASRQPSRKLEAFPFKHKGRDTRVTFHCTEFTCMCPLTGQPDYATLEIEYIPAGRALESKSLKNYLWSYRDTGVFHEDVVNVILDELYDFLKPKWMRVTGHFNVRGGIAIEVSAER
jgi:7-cyano-7-deazaguanine reductase